MTEEIKACKIFYSYAPEDRSLRDELDKHLMTLRHLGLISTWYDQDIQAGSEWMNEVNHHLISADIILVLISSYFLASDYCTGIEMKKALERHNIGEAKIIPILLRPVEWEGLPLTQLRMLPPGGIPITNWKDEHQAFAAIAKELRKVILNWQISLNRFTVPGLNGDFLNDNDAIVEPRAPAKLLSQPVSVTQSTPPTINTHSAVILFHQLLKADSPLRILSLVGDGKMGKTHLLTKVFPSVAKMHQIQYVNIDLRHVTRVPDILHQICNYLGISKFSHYKTAYQSWMDTMYASELKQFTWLHKLLFFLHLSPSSSPTTSYERDSYFTKLFIDELMQFTKVPLLFLFDSTDAVNKNIQHWLFHILLTQLIPVSNIQIVIAGRSLPEADGNYSLHLEQYQLQPITDITEYIAYCQKLEATLNEETIEVLAHGFDYVPGMFTDFVHPKFVRAKPTYG